MEIQAVEQLVAKKCKPCEGGVDPCAVEDAQRQIARLQGWQLVHDGQRIRKEWKVKNFMAAMRFFNKVAEIAEEDGHHPDLHLVGYRNVAIELWTHAIGGLSENDFILAAKIDRVPIEVKS
jgi:4a-hydroxytetrahydrobiopterin dehydratase